MNVMEICSIYKTNMLWKLNLADFKHFETPLFI